MPPQYGNFISKRDKGMKTLAKQSTEMEFTSFPSGVLIVVTKQKTGKSHLCVQMGYENK